MGTLFRYRSLAGDGFRFAQEIFLRHRLFLPLHSQLNDPAEGVYRIATPLEKRGDRWVAPDLPLIRHEGTVRILSFSEDAKHPLMWAHYADSHRGICLGFDTSYLTRIAQVRYPTRIPRLDPKLPDARKLEAAFLTKRAAWSYEREWRIIQSEAAEDSYSYINFPPHAITEVVLGHRITEDDEDWVRQWLRLGECKARLRRATFSGSVGRLHLVDAEGENESRSA